MIRLLFRCFQRTIFLLLAVPCFFAGGGCIKEYSFEQGAEDTITAAVPLPSPGAVFSSCTSCNSPSIPDSSWRLTIGNRVFCGQAEKAIISPDRTGFTFFGASFCSGDSGFVATVYINNVRLDADHVNVTAKMGAYYYDRIGATHPYESIPSLPLQLTIHTYTHQTGIATGIFSGSIVNRAGTTMAVKDGRFRIRLSR